MNKLGEFFSSVFSVLKVVIKIVLIAIVIVYALVGASFHYHIIKLIDMKGEESVMRFFEGKEEAKTYPKMGEVYGLCVNENNSYALSGDLYRLLAQDEKSGSVDLFIVEKRQKVTCPKKQFDLNPLSRQEFLDALEAKESKKGLKDPLVQGMFFVSGTCQAKLKGEKVEIDLYRAPVLKVSEFKRDENTILKLSMAKSFGEIPQGQSIECEKSGNSFVFTQMKESDLVALDKSNKEDDSSEI